MSGESRKLPTRGYIFRILYAQKETCEFKLHCLEDLAFELRSCEILERVGPMKGNCWLLGCRVYQVKFVFRNNNYLGKSKVKIKSWLKYSLNALQQSRKTI